MNDTPENPTPAELPEKEVSESLLADAIEGLRARGDRTVRFACMGLPAPVFNDLCRRLLSRGEPVKATAEWLALEMQARGEDTPTRSSVERFSRVLQEEYDLARFRDRAATAERFFDEATKGDPDARQLAANAKLTELLTAELMAHGDAGEIDTKRLLVLIAGVNSVSKVVFDKQKMDARIKALETAIANTKKAMELKDQKLQELPDKVRALQDKLSQIETAQSQGQKIDPRIYAAMREQLVALARLSDPSQPAPTAGGAA